MNVNYSKHTLDNKIEVYFDTDPKFNTASFDMGLYTDLREELAAKNTLMVNVLGRESSFSNIQKIEQRLTKYYGAHIEQISSSLLNVHYTSFIGSALTKSPHPGELPPITLTLDLLSEMVQHPLIKYRRIGGKGRFVERNVELERENIQDRINDMIMNKSAYAMRRFQRHLYKDKHIARGNLGDVEEYDRITPGELADHYNDMMKSGERFKIFMTGNFDEKRVLDQLQNKFSNIKSEKEPEQIFTNDIEICDSQTIIEEMPGINQSNLYMVYKTGVTYDDKLRYASAIMDTILGGSPSSKIFTEVREKHSLAYSAGSGHDKQIGLQFLTAAIDAKNYGQTAELMIKQVEEMKAGNFSQQDIDSAKKQLISSSQSIEDSTGQRRQIMQNLAIIGKEELITNNPIPAVKKVTKKDIIEAAQRIDIDSEVTYLMRPQNEEEN